MDSDKVEKFFSKGLTGDYELPRWAAVFILVAALASAGAYYGFGEYKGYQARQAERDSVLLTQQQELEKAKGEIEALKGGGAVKAQDILASEPQSRLATVVKGWRPRVAAVECHWDGLFGEEIDYGSGLWLSSNNTIITSDHVVVREGVRLGPPAKADFCLVKLPEGESVTVGAEDISSWRGVEGVSAISIKNPPASMARVQSSLSSVCKNAAPAGERMAVLGYPTIGVKGDVTVTEGIISGYEDNFYIVSAKIEKGMSGGVAVLIDKNCYLGIPTFVQAGEVESLGRILDSRLLIK